MPRNVYGSCNSATTESRSLVIQVGLRRKERLPSMTQDRNGRAEGLLPLRLNESAMKDCFRPDS